VRLATLRVSGSTFAVRVDGDTAVVVSDARDVGALLADPAWRERADAASGEVLDLSDLEPSASAPVVPRPSKIVCVGLNYREHILEMGRELPEYPTLFAKFA
jgi:acylpyruvate hydrolase